MSLNLEMFLLSKDTIQTRELLGKMGSLLETKLFSKSQSSERPLLVSVVGYPRAEDPTSWDGVEAGVR